MSDKAEYIDMSKMFGDVKRADNDHRKDSHSHQVKLRFSLVVPLLYATADCPHWDIIEIH